MPNPTPRDIFGDDGITLLQQKGYKREHIRAMAQSAFNSRREAQIKEQKKIYHDAKKMDSPLMRIGAGISDATLETWRGISKYGEDIANAIDPHRKSAMDGEYSETNNQMGRWSKRLKEYQSNYEKYNNVGFDYAHFIGELGGGFASDPVNLFPISMGVNLLKRGLGLAVTGAISGNIAAYGGDRSRIEGTAMGAIATPVIGEMLHQTSKGIAKLWTRQKARKANSETDMEALENNELFDMDTFEEADEIKPIVKHEKQMSFESFFNNLLDGEGLDVRKKVYDDIQKGNKKSVIDKSKYDDLVEFKRYEDTLLSLEHREKEYNVIEEAMNNLGNLVSSSHDQSVIRHNNIQKDAQKEISANPNILPSELKTLINAKHKPEPEEVLITSYINDGSSVENRLAGWNVFYALQKDIKNPVRTPMEYKEGLQKAGFNEESSSAFAAAYEQGDIQVAQDFITEKIQEKGSQDVLQKASEATNNADKKPNGDVRVRTKQTRVPREGNLNGYDSQGGDGTQLKNQEHLQSGNDNVKGAIRDAGQNTPSDSEVRGVPKSDENVARLEAFGGDESKFSKYSRDNVVRPENADDIRTEGANTNNLKEEKPTNFDLTEKEPITLTKAQRKTTNEQVETILQKPKEETTLEDKEILRQYTGKGGIEKGTRGSLSEHYTPYKTIRGIYKALDKSGIKIKKALEPSAGSGNFVGHKPNLDWTTIDIDSKAHAINERLYPKAKHYNMSFEKFKEGDFDLVISNVPFVETRGAHGVDVRADIKTLHDFFFVHGIDRVKDDGVVTYIAPRGIMDKVSNKIRKEIVSKADVIGAYRLPDKTFSKNAHTDVGADIIFLQKRGSNKSVSKNQLADNEAFVHSVKTGDGIYLNEYFSKNPEHILGNMQVGVNKQYGNKAYVVNGEADYSKIKLSFDNKTAIDKVKKVPNEVPKNSKDFMEYGKNNGLEIGSLDDSKVLIDENGVRVMDKEILFDDIDDGALIYKDITSTKDGSKILLLQKIAKLGDVQDTLGIKLVQEYKKLYKQHPLNDKNLKGLFKKIKSEDTLFRLGSYFDKKFNPSKIFKEQTKHIGSGKVEISSDSSLQDKLLSWENNKGKITFDAKNELMDAKNIHKLFDSGYSLSSENVLQNNILYYSGNLYDKMDELNGLVEKYVDNAKISKQLEVQKKKLEEMLPNRKTIEEINIRGDENWILKNGLEIYPLKTVQRVINKGEQVIREIQTPFGKIFDNYINSRALIIAKKDESATAYRRRLREANEEVQKILNDIKEMIIQNPKMVEKIESIYNKKFNGYVSPNYKKATYMIEDVLEELPAKFRLRDNQKEWITKALYEGKGINAHDVGGGKTFSGVVLARALKKKGVVKKPLFVVPAKVINNWEKEIKTIYPEAKVINLFNLPKNTRAKKLYELGNNPADYVLISHEGFKALKLPSEVEMKYVDELMREYIRTDDLKGRALALQKEKIDRYKEVLQRENKNKKITLDNLGIDGIFADEARAFKNIGVHSKLTQFKLGKPFSLNVKKDGSVGIDSAIAYDFRFKTKYISENNNGNNIFMLDATPTPNKPMEIYTMLKHLDDNIFDEYGIKTDREFANRFFEYGVVVDKKGKTQHGLTYIKNAFELRSIMDRYVERISMDEFKNRGIIELPEEKVNTHYLESSDESDEVFTDIQNRLKEAKNDAQMRHKVMGIFSEGVSASSDPRAYQRGGIREFINPTPENNKIESVVEKVSNKFSKNKKSGQIIFLDNAGHEQGKAREIDEILYEPTLEKNLHQEIKDKLLEKGYKANEIAIISGKEITNPQTGKEVVGASGKRAANMKQSIVEFYNKGDVKVIIGTTKGAGEGMNIQKYTTDIYHIDLPWTPAEIIQRNGRGVRFGNENRQVDVHYFFQAGTFDELMYKTIINKRGWNEALWDAKVKNKIEITDEGSSMPSDEEFMLQMEKDPIKRRELELSIEYARLEDELYEVKEEGLSLKFKKSSLKRGAESLKNEIAQKKDLLKIDTPNKYLANLQQKIVKTKDVLKREKLQKEFDTKLQGAKKNIQNIILSKKRRLEKIFKEIEKNEKDIAFHEKDILSVQNKLKEFETMHVKEDGEFKSELEEIC